jgi:hypothetical protein
MLASGLKRYFNLRSFQTPACVIPQQSVSSKKKKTVPLPSSYRTRSRVFTFSVTIVGRLPVPWTLGPLAVEDNDTRALVTAAFIRPPHTWQLTSAGTLVVTLQFYKVESDGKCSGSQWEWLGGAGWEPEGALDASWLLLAGYL